MLVWFWEFYLLATFKAISGWESRKGRDIYEVCIYVFMHRLCTSLVLLALDTSGAFYGLKVVRVLLLSIVIAAMFVLRHINRKVSLTNK